METIAELSIRLFEPGDAFRLLGAVDAVSKAEKTVRFEGGYETQDNSTLEVDFQGTIADAKLLKEFLDPQMRAETEKNLQSTFVLQFDGGLSMAGTAAETLTEKLARFASSAAYVSATATAGK